MPKYGCCSQGLLFSRQSVLELIERLHTKGAGQIDSMIEHWADKQDLVRWAVTPSLLQHIGRKSSRGDDFGTQFKYSMSVAQKIWNFGFEKNDPAELKRLKDAARVKQQSWHRMGKENLLGPG